MGARWIRRELRYIRERASRWHREPTTSDARGSVRHLRSKFRIDTYLAPSNRSHDRRQIMGHANLIVKSFITISTHLLQTLQVLYRRTEFAREEDY